MLWSLAQLVTKGNEQSCRGCHQESQLKVSTTFLPSLHDHRHADYQKTKWSISLKWNHGTPPDSLTLVSWAQRKPLTCDTGGDLPNGSFGLSIKDSRLSRRAGRGTERRQRFVPGNYAHLRANGLHNSMTHGICCWDSFLWSLCDLGCKITAKSNGIRDDQFSLSTSSTQYSTF